MKNSIFSAFENQQLENPSAIVGGRKILDRGEAGDNVGLLVDRGEAGDNVGLFTGSATTLDRGEAGDNVGL